MKKIKVIINGLPSKIARAVALALVKSKKFELLPVSLTTFETSLNKVVIDGFSIKLLKPDLRALLLALDWPDIIIDLMPASIVDDNVDFYAKVKVPFVLGTMGGDFDYISSKVEEAGINAVIFPDMIKEFTTLKMMFSSISTNLLELSTEYEFEIVKNTPHIKDDSRDLTKSIITVFNRMGIPISSHLVNKKSDETDGHAQGKEINDGFRTFNLKKKDGTIVFSFTHNLNGQQALVDSILRVTTFLYNKELDNISYGRVFTMFEALK